MPRPGKSWTDKLHDATPHAVKPAPIDIAGMRAGQMMLVPTPQIVDAYIRTIPPGTDLDLKTVRARLAAQFGAEVTCPITTGFHLRTVAEAAMEARRNGASLADIAPV